jgi:AraC family transcriptional regulator
MNCSWMKTRSLGLVCMLSGIFGVASAADSIPAHWFLSGYPSPPRGEYSVALERTLAYEGTGSGLLKSIAPNAQHGTLMQSAAADSYKGKKIKLRAFLRSRDVIQRAGLWVRSNDAAGTVLTFRNCFSPGARQSFVRGDSDWRAAEISLDVPATAVELAFGVQMVGTGSVWIDNVTIEVTGESDPAAPQFLPVTMDTPIVPSNPPGRPQNLDFEQ